MEDDTGCPDFPDISENADPTASGIVQCLRMLAEEAAALNLPRTQGALQAAIEVCALEGAAADGSGEAGDIRLRAAGSRRVH